MNVWSPVDNLRVWGIQHIDPEAVRQGSRPVKWCKSASSC